MIYDYQFRSRFCDLANGKLHYLDEGDGPVVVLLHGNPTWSYYYRSLTRRLTRYFRVIVPDHLGCGLSDKPQDYDYTLANHITNLRGLLENLKISQISLVVHDWGGPIGIGLAAEKNVAVDRYVILNTAAFRSRRIPLRIRICRWPVVGRFLVRGLNGFAWPATFMAVQKKLSRSIASGYLKPYDNWNNRVALHEFVVDIPLADSHRSYRSLVEVELYLDTIKCDQTPILVVWGGRDFCFNDHFYRQWRRRFPDAEFHYLADAGHYVLEDAPEKAEPLIESFLRGDRSASADRKSQADNLIAP